VQHIAHGPIGIAIALASLDLSVLDPSPLADASSGQLRNVLEINVAGIWLTAREWLRGLRQARRTGTSMRNPNLSIIGNETGLFVEARNAEYSLSKSAVKGRWEQECIKNPYQYYVDAQPTV
jgi:NAD(P)-dependent dehydrogenase (short-subunit alcohol dehydrogenase family)